MFNNWFDDTINDFYNHKKWIEVYYMKYLFQMTNSDLLKIPSYLIKCRKIPFTDVNKYRNRINILPKNDLQKMILSKYGEINYNNIKSPKYLTHRDTKSYILRVYRRSDIEKNISTSDIQMRHIDKCMNNIKEIVNIQENIYNNLTDFKYRMDLAGCDIFNDVDIKFKYNIEGIGFRYKLKTKNKLAKKIISNSYIMKKYLHDSKLDIKRVVYETITDYRENILEKELEKYGLKIRHDSKLCRKYIETATPSLYFIVNKVVSINFYYKLTDYKKMLTTISNSFYGNYYHYSEKGKKENRQKAKKIALDEYIKENNNDIKTITAIPQILKCRLDVYTILKHDEIIKDIKNRIQYLATAEYYYEFLTYFGKK